MRISFWPTHVFFLSLTVWTLTAIAISAGPQRNTAPTFASASVKPSLPGQFGPLRETSPGRFDARNYPLRRLIAMAYEYGSDIYRVA